MKEGFCGRWIRRRPCTIGPQPVRAGFIGSPSMNFFEMQLIRSGDDLCAQSETLRLRIPLDRHTALQDYVGKRSWWGAPRRYLRGRFRRARIKAAAIEAQVDVTELMAMNLLVPAQRAHSFIARVDPRSRARPATA